MNKRAGAVALVLVPVCAVFAAAQEVPPASPVSTAAPEALFAQVPMTAATPKEIPPVPAPQAEPANAAPPAPAVREEAPAPATVAAAPEAEPPAAVPAIAADEKPVPAAAVAEHAPEAPAQASPAAAPAPSGQTIVKFKNGSIMPCRIIREDAGEIVVESEGVQFPLVRGEIEYYGDAANCPGVSSGEFVAEGARETADRFKPAVNVIAPPGEAAAPSPPSKRTPTREERFRALQRKPGAGPAAAARPPAPQGVTIAALNEDPSRFQGQRLVFPNVRLGVLQAHAGFYGLEVLPPEAQKGGRHRGGSSPDLTMRGITFTVTEAQAKDLREHSKQYDRARIECSVEPRVVGANRYWVAPVARLDVLRGDGNEVSWTMW